MTGCSPRARPDGQNDGMPVLMTRPEFEDLVAEALDLIPAEFTKAMDNVVILVEDFIVIGRVAGIHIDDRFISDGRVNTAAMKLIARLGYSEYATVVEAWRMRRPD